MWMVGEDFVLLGVVDGRATTYGELLGGWDGGDALGDGSVIQVTLGGVNG